ncbi:flagellar operon protein [Butyrivibrio fibrisolvens DSM 3071]|jgi:flagellar operon protein|uniref:Flagellar operon protein n=1 Tax=Butyrivibrio fibrisolvens DSM 3071 TaxID=1121131 RepID=A0A1M5YUQ2_BUTFI|nr:TIGR02530 family flagellar biosynthesis protein [Butyrivibrio fibrisolvens]SHI15534.1 flagellar operon protein [Butyrivibrio fibrisolvens DSM 3071]
MNSLNPSFLSIDQVQGQYLGKDKVSKPNVQIGEGKESFASILDKAQELKKLNEPLKFSKHAAARLSDRNIEITKQQLERLNQGKIQAGEKGISESLILVDSLAFIVNVPNNTVVTAMNQNDKSDSKVFTNIDGAVIA